MRNADILRDDLEFWCRAGKDALERIPESEDWCEELEKIQEVAEVLGKLLDDYEGLRDCA